MSDAHVWQCKKLPPSISNNSQTRPKMSLLGSWRKIASYYFTTAAVFLRQKSGQQANWKIWKPFCRLVNKKKCQIGANWVIFYDPYKVTASVAKLVFEVCLLTLTQMRKILVKAIGSWPLVVVHLWKEFHITFKRHIGWPELRAQRRINIFKDEMWLMALFVTCFKKNWPQCMKACK